MELLAVVIGYLVCAGIVSLLAYRGTAVKSRFWENILGSGLAGLIWPAALIYCWHCHR